MKRLVTRSALSAVIRRESLRGVVIVEHLLDVEGTRRLVETLATEFEFVGHDQLMPALRRRPRGRPVCLLTFDDGKAAHRTLVAPELARLGVPAVFFSCTGHAASGEPMWFDRLAALRRRGRVPAGLELGVLKQLPNGEIDARLDAAVGEEPLDLGNPVTWRPMSLDELRELRDMGFVVGAHCVGHVIVRNESIESARAEVEQSIGTITCELGSCPSFAFPNGIATAELSALAIAAGATTVMTTQPTWLTETTQRHAVPRIMFDADFSGAKIEAKLVAAAGSILPDPNGTGRAIARRAGADQPAAVASIRSSAASVSIPKMAASSIASAWRARSSSVRCPSLRRPVTTDSARIEPITSTNASRDPSAKRSFRARPSRFQSVPE